MTANMPASSGTMAKSPYDAAPAAKAPVSDTASVEPTVKADKPVKTARQTKDDAALNQAEDEQTAQLNSAAARATRNGSVPVPLPATPASSVASNGQSTPQADGMVEEIPAPPAATSEQQTTPTAQPEQTPQAQPAQVQPQ